MPRGGKRKGAGRKPAPNKKKSYATKLYPEKIEFLKGFKNASKWLDEAIDFKRDAELHGQSEVIEECLKLEGSE